MMGHVYLRRIVVVVHICIARRPAVFANKIMPPAKCHEKCLVGVNDVVAGAVCAMLFEVLHIVLVCRVDAIQPAA